MKPILLAAVFCLALNSGMGAPRTAKYMFVRCKPEGGRANCVTHQSPEVVLSPEVPAKLPASAAQHLDAEPVEDESPQMKKEEEEEMKEDKMPMIGEEGESPEYILPEEGSGGYEGSAVEGPFVQDRAFEAAESETGSGESWIEKDMDPFKGGDRRGMRRLFRSRSLDGEAKPAEHELRDDHLLQL